MSPILKAFIFTLIAFGLTVALSLLVGAMIKLIAVVIHRSHNRIASDNVKK
jgi:hypothetical protein